MRTAWMSGVLLAVGGVLLLLIGSWMDLEIAPAALVGLALGGALAGAPGASDGARLAGATLGVLAAVVGYALRALELPDSVGGAAVALVVVIAICTVPAALLRERLPLWAALLGAGAFAGIYETAFAAAPAEMASTAVTALTTTLLVVGAGFLLGTAAVGRSRTPSTSSVSPAPAHSLETTS